MMGLQDLIALERERVLQLSRSEEFSTIARKLLDAFEQEVVIRCWDRLQRFHHDFVLHCYRRLNREPHDWYLARLLCSQDEYLIAVGLGASTWLERPPMSLIERTASIANERCGGKNDPVCAWAIKALEHWSRYSAKDSGSAR